jgi:fructuronate reductase
MRREYRPNVAVPQGVDLDEYERQLFSRWRNSALEHRTSQVGSDGSVKIRQRIPAAALALLDAGVMPHVLALTAAGYLACLAPMDGFDPGPQAAAMKDPARAMLQQAAAASGTGRQLARHVIGDRQLLGADLAQRSEFTDRVGELVDVIRRHGVPAAVSDAVA